MRNWWLFPGLVLGLGLNILAAGHSLAAQPQVIRLAAPGISSGSTQSSGTAAVDYAYVQQLLEKEFTQDGIQIRWVFFKNAGPAVNEAFANQQIDFAFLGDLPAIIGEAVGNQTRLLAASARRINGYLGVVPGRDYRSLEELRGKTLGVWLGTANQLALNAVLAREGYSPQDFRIISLDLGASLAALAGRRVDAVWSTAGILSLNGVGLAEIPLSTQGNDGLGTIATLVLGSTAFVERYPDVTARVLRVLVAAAYWSSQPEQREAVINLLAQQTGQPPRLFAREYQQEPNLARNYSPLLDPFLLNHLRYGAQSAYQQRLIRRRIDIESWIEPRFLQQALQALNLEHYWEPQPAYANPSL